MGLTHFEKNGRAVMVDVTEKETTSREAEAVGKIVVNQEVLMAIKNGTAKKGDVLGVATTAGIMAAKRTFELIPMCHLLNLTGCKISFDLREEESTVYCSCTVKTKGQTGVEMEALTGVSTALLTIYDMCKAMDKTMEIGGIYLKRKSGGKSGEVFRE